MQRRTPIRATALVLAAIAGLAMGQQGRQPEKPAPHAATGHASTQMQTATGPAKADARVKELIAQLASAKVAERDAASRALVAIGRPARTALQAAAESNDVERALRASEVLEEIRARTARLAIYLVTQPSHGFEAQKVALADLQLADRPTVTDEDIEWYDANRHVFQITKAGTERLAHPKVRGVGEAFVIVADGNRIYQGGFTSVIASVAPSTPRIDLPMGNRGAKPLTITPPTQGEDPRGDERIRKVLRETNKLRPAAPATQPASRPATAGGATIVGSVFDEPGGKRAQAVDVTLCVGGDVIDKTVTAGDGTYRFTGVRYTGMAHAVRVGKHGPGVWTEDALVFVDKKDANGEIRAIDLHLKLPSLSGTVADADTGKPAGGVGINFSTVNNREGVVTDGNGRFLLYVLPRKVDLYCSGTYDRYYPGTPIRKADPNAGPASRGADSSSDESGSVKVDVKAGMAVQGVDFQVRSAPPFSGRVLLPDGKPAAGVPLLAMLRWSRSTVQEGKRIAEARARRAARVQAGAAPAPAPPPRNARAGRGGLMEAGVGMDFRMKTDAQGQFHGYMRRPSETNKDEAIDIIVLVRTPDEASGGMAILQTTTIDPPPGPIEVRLAATAQAEFQVVNPDGQSLPEAKPTSGSVLFGYIVFGYDIKEIQPRFTPLGQGRFRASGLVPGWDYRVRAEAAGFRCPRELPVVAQADQKVDAGTLVLDWWGAKAVPGLLDALAAADQYKRAEACRLLGSLGTDAAPAIASLIEALNGDKINSVRFAAAEALGKIGPAAKEAVPHLIRALEQDGSGVPREAAMALGRIGDPAATAALKAATVHADSDARQAAVAALDNPAFLKADPGIAELLRVARKSKRYEGADLVLLALGPEADLRIARMVQEVCGREPAHENAKHVLGVLIGQLYENGPENVAPAKVLAWWWSYPLPQPTPPPAKLDANQLDALWASLADEEGPAAHRSTLALAAGREPAAAFLAQQLKPVSVDGRRVAALIAQLDDDKLVSRRQAFDELALLGRAAESALKETLAGKASAEVRARVQELLDAAACPYPATPGTRRVARAVRVLELIGSPQTRATLETLAKGEPNAFLTAQAQAALRRIQKGTTPPAATAPTGR